MFSGIIESVGKVAAIERRAGGVQLRIASALRRLLPGESVAVSGVCLTVTRARGGTFAVDVSQESLRRTTLGSLTTKARVNLERSLRLADRLGGHFVFGHVDGIGRLQWIRRQGESALYRFAVPAAIGALLVEKGSIAVDGVSLTVFDCSARAFTVAVIPHTAAVTTFGRMRAGDRVNLESDMLARYVAKAVALNLKRRRRQ